MKSRLGPENSPKWARRAPYGARGLKCWLGEHIVEIAESRPIRGAWIEIGPASAKPSLRPVAPHTGRVD